MKILSVISSVFFMFMLLAACAQESEIKKIREIYNSYNQKITEQGNDMQQGLPMKIVIKSALNERAVGPVEKSVTFYYDRTENVENDKFTYADILRKIIITEEASWKSYTEFLFDEKGKFVFSYLKHEGYMCDCREERYYFKNGELIRIILNKNPDGMFPEECADGTRELTKLTPKDKQNAAAMQKKATRYLEIFNLYVHPF